MEELKNKVISREYVEKNYIKKEDLLKWLEMEMWGDIKGFEGKYQISTEGQVASLNYNNTGERRILVPKINKQGHLEVTLNKDNKHYYRMVARLVLETFLGIKLGKNDIIMYKDASKAHCSLSNMFLITRGKRQELTYDGDRRYRPKYEYYGEELPTKEIAKRNNINPKTVRNRVRDLYWNIYEAAEIPISVYKKR